MPSKYWDISKDIDKDLIYHIKDATFFMKNPQISQCIDWRRTPSESNFGMSVPWGGVWQLAIILSVLEETIIAQDSDFRNKALEILFEVVGGKENLSYHTDDHCKEWEIWCWHITLLLWKEARKMYGLSDTSADFIKDVIERQKSTAILNVLKWWHAEKGIIKIFSTHYSVHAHYDAEQYFIYTPKIAYIRNKEIARKIYKTFVVWTSLSITAEALAHMLQHKMDLSFFHTIHTLAPDLPIYRMKHSLNGNIKYLEKLADKAINMKMHDTPVELI